MATDNVGFPGLGCPRTSTFNLYGKLDMYRIVKVKDAEMNMHLEVAFDISTCKSIEV